MESGKITFWGFLLLSGFLFQALFYGHQMGLNTLVFSCFTIGGAWFLFKDKKGELFLLLTAALLLATLAVLVGHTTYSLVVYWICYVAFAGVVSYPAIKNLQFGPLFILQSVKQIPAMLSAYARRNNLPSRIRYSSFLRFVILPLAVVVSLLVIYSLSNKLFAQSVTNIADHIVSLFQDFSFGRLLFFIIGFLLVALFYATHTNSSLVLKDQNLSFELIRNRAKKALVKTLSRLLLRKQQVAILLFILLNIMIGWLNYLDITHIWFGFSWDGGFLKGMVHEGTNLLIAALLISIAVSLYYLNSNLVFMKNNTLFNRLIILWLGQNLIMVVSVVLRNTYYIEYFALAYKRIFVYFFLLACVIGIVSIMYKIIKQRSTGFLMSVNSVSVYAIFLVAACFNWDAIIARYNFNHYKTSFIHYEFLRDLNNAALPYLLTNEETLKQIDEVQTGRFSFSSGSEYKKFAYAPTVEQRKKWFKEEWEQRTWLDWNLPESKAYSLLTQQ